MVLVTSTQPVSMQLIRNVATLRIEQGIPPSDFLKVEDNKTSSVFFAVPPGAGIAIVSTSRKDAQVKVDEIAPR